MGYIERKEFATAPWSAKAPIAAWSIENYGTVTEIEPITTWKMPAIDGMFFDSLVGYWGVSDNLKRLSINWQTGPRFGRGFVYPILETPGGVLNLGVPKTTWFS